MFGTDLLTTVLSLLIFDPGPDLPGLLLFQNSGGASKLL